MRLDYTAQVPAVIIVFVNWVTVFEYLRRRQRSRGPILSGGRGAVE